VTATVRYRKPIELLRLGRQHAIVEASAGTGKTYVLEHLVIELLLSTGATLEQILLVTFTEKAAAELTHRIRRKLEELVDMDAGHPRAREAADAPDEECWRLDGPARERLRRALLGFDRASIFTIHAFCQRVLNENAFLHGRLFDEEAVNEEEAFHAAFVETLRREIAPDPSGALLLEAWRRAGQDLARLERRVLFECHKKLAGIHPPRPDSLRPEAVFDPERIARAVAAWPVLDEDDERLCKTLQRSKIHYQTARSLVARLRAVTTALGAAAEGPAALLGAIERLERASTWTKKKDGLFRSIYDAAAPKVAGDPVVDVIRQAALALDAALPPLAALLTARILPPTAARLARRKREAGQFDFQDMLTLVARSLEGDGPRARGLIAALRARYRHALVDEFQDTDEVQWQIFRRLFFTEGAQVLTLVGDPKQSIYSFRGADVHTYLRARGEVEAVQPAVFLSASFRATADLVAAQNAILEQRDPQPFFRADGAIQYDHPVSCGQPELALLDGAGQPAPPVVVLDVARDPAAAPGAKLPLWQIKPALLGAMAGEIGRLLAQPTRLFLRQRPGQPAVPIGARDIYVLTRTIRESREIGEALRAARIPFAYFKQEKLFDTLEAREVRDLLRALADPDDRTARLRAWITGFFGLTLPELAACDDLPADHPLMARLQEWRGLGEAGRFDRLFARIIDDSGIVCRALFAHGSGSGSGERSLTNVLHLFELLQEEAARGRCTLRELAQRLGSYVAGTRRPPEQESDVQRLETDADAVQIMTIHQSKGLEAAVVFVYGATWRFPGSNVRAFHDAAGRRVIRVGRQPEQEERIYFDEEDDEERRVLYVALTRARARLYLPRYPLKPIISLRGSYRFINERLHALLGGITPDQVRRLFAAVPVLAPSEVAPAAGGAALAGAIAGWEPPAALLAAAETPADFRLAADTRAGFLVTSYSAVSRRQGRFVPTGSVGDLDADGAGPVDSDGDGDPDGGGGAAVTIGDPIADPDPDPDELDLGAAVLAPTLSPPDELPRGRLSGSFLHELLEHLPLDTLVGRPPLEDWRRRPQIEALFERMRRRHDRRAAHLPHAQRLIHTALTVPVRLGDAMIEGGLASVEMPTREMEFLFPIPERAHPLFLDRRVDEPAGGAKGDVHGDGRDSDGRGGHGDSDGDADGPPRLWPIGRGVVKGFIDYLFQHEGRVYVCDWKGDWLPDWQPARLAAHCEQHYAVQAQLYTLATLRLLGLTGGADFDRRFGGVLYCFLRGMREGDPGAGLFFHRPSWPEIIRWERSMLEPRYWGLS
jgi:exodeoxyribonuclease V beta subunit